MPRKILKWELTGIAAISLLGALFHFLFELTGEWPPAGFFTAVNESVFEHLKLTFWPTVIYAAATYRVLKNQTDNFFTAKAAAVYVMPLVILALFYAYTELTGWESLALDIVIFVIAIAAGQLVSYKIMTLERLPRLMNYVSPVLIVGLALVYGLLTFYPPHISMFLDSNTGVYGIP